MLFFTFLLHFLSRINVYYCSLRFTHTTFVTHSDNKLVILLHHCFAIAVFHHFNFVLMYTYLNYSIMHWLNVGLKGLQMQKWPGFYIIFLPFDFSCYGVDNKLLLYFPTNLRVHSYTISQLSASSFSVNILFVRKTYWTVVWFLSIIISMFRSWKFLERESAKEAGTFC